MRNNRYSELSWHPVVNNPFFLCGEMCDHNAAVFNNLCLTVPKGSDSDRSQKYLHQLQNQEIRNSDRMMGNDKATLKSFIDFFDSIPEYDDINHLSNKDFYKKLETLKQKQRTYYELMKHELKYENKDTEWIEDYKKLSIGDKKLNDVPKMKPSIKPFCGTPLLNKRSGRRKNLDDVESLSFSDKEISNKPPSRRSVRIETPLSDKISLDNTPENTPKAHFRSKSRLTSADSSKKGTEWDDLSIDDLKLDLEKDMPLETRSVPNSPRKQDNNVITIPKPFQMTVRDEENKIVEDIFIKMNKPKPEKHEQFKAHDIPIESQIPLFDKIMEDQERRNFVVRERRKAALQAQMRPFSFTKRDEELQALTKQFSQSTPSLYLDDPPLKIKKFKAKPVPKNLFSNYIYKKMHEDEFYRALQKKIRAEEMLKAASLPPSMSKRERRKPKYDVCPRSYRDVPSKESGKRRKKVPNFRFAHEQFEKELEELKNEFISTSPRPFKLRTSRKGRRLRNCSASSKSSDTRTNSSMELQSVSRSNLAAVLRIQSARQRLDMEMCRKLEEAKLKEEVRWREKLMRKKPVWQALAYSNEEDLAMRLQLRREEEKLRREEHQLRMQLMLGRVHQQPTLFERQSRTNYPKTKQELMDTLYKTYKRSPRRSISDLSDLRSMVEMKDEAIQTLIEEKLISSSDSNLSKESLPEEKEKCDCFDDEN